jgi:hypothetical protein
MSVELCVFLKKDRIPTYEEWQKAILCADRPLTLESFSPVDHSGFVPTVLDGQECGFEYFFTPIAEDEFNELATVTEDRNYLASFVWHSSMVDGTAANIAAAALADIADGVFFDPQSGAYAIGKDAYSLREDLVASDRDGKLAAAEKKWADATERRCPKCNAPCPEYRAKCWVCGHHLGRAALPDEGALSQISPNILDSSNQGVGISRQAVSWPAIMLIAFALVLIVGLVLIVNS